MNAKNAVKKMVSLDNYLGTQNGYPVYDLMQETYRTNGYNQKLLGWGASGVVFYTEDETLLEKLHDVRTKDNLELLKQFLLENTKCLKLLSEVEKHSPTMNDKQYLAFKHLRDKEHIANTLKNGFYGAAHLIEDDKLLVFRQNGLYMRDFVENKDLNTATSYNKMQLELRRLYNENKIQPECELTSGAFKKVSEHLFNISPKLSNYQKDTVLLLTQFNQTILPEVFMANETVDSAPAVMFKNNSIKMIVVLPENKKEQFKVEADGNIRLFNNVPDLLKHINEEFSNSKVLSFLKRNKM